MLRVRWPRSKSVDALYRALNGAGYDQADLVLCLLRVNTRRALRSAERLVGRSITRCPPALRRRPLPLLNRDTEQDGRRVTRVRPPPPLPSGRQTRLRNWHLVRVGLTVTQLRQRGVSARVLKLARRRGWVELSA